MKITRMSVGDGFLPDGAAETEQTAMANEVASLEISSFAIEGNQAIVRADFNNAGLEADFYYRELGLFARPVGGREILYCAGFWTDARAALLDRLDATVSSRSTQTSVDNLQAGCGALQATVDAVQTSVSTINTNTAGLDTRIGRPADAYSSWFI